MEFNFWSILLIASASQCCFLLAVLSTRPGTNKAAKSMLLILLGVVLAVTISNLITSSYLYRTHVEFSGFGRGMVLLLGPLFYLYVQAVINPSHHLQISQLIHFVPYIIAITIIQIQNIGISDEIFIMSIDALMTGEVPMTMGSTLWFLFYFLHLMVYLILVHHQLNKMLNKTGRDYKIDFNHRTNWLRKLSLLFILLTILFLLISGYCLVVHSYTIVGNFIYTILLACIVFLVANQAIRDPQILTPNFTFKYKGLSLDQQWSNTIREKLIVLFETEKIFTNPDIKLQHIAQQLDTKPYLISRLINLEFGLSFSEYLNHYRIEEFKARIADSKFENHSIIGIAYGVGYNSKSTFNSAFKRLVGKTPTQYLASLSGK